MEHREDDRMVAVCSDCAPKPGSFTGQDPKSFVGKLVKIAFDATKHDGTKTKEHMWVQVREHSAGEWVSGVLVNTPFWKMNFRKGDQVGLKVSDIEQVYDPKTKGN
jgi:hypothetical protein